MHCTCVRHTELPNTSALFADVLYHPDRTASFYRHPYRELSSFHDAAREIDLSDERRAALVAALREQTPESDSLAKLAELAESDQIEVAAMDLSGTIIELATLQAKANQAP